MHYELNLTVPKSWTDLRQTQLRFLYHTMAMSNLLHTSPFTLDSSSASWAAVAVTCILRWNRLKKLSPYADGFLFKINKRPTTKDQRPKTNDQRPTFQITNSQLADLAYCMQWIREPSSVPVRLKYIDGAEAMPADLSEGMTFEEWLACENLWQGYQATQDDTLLREMAAILYHKPDIRLAPHESISIFYWWASVKIMMPQRFPHFFQPASGIQNSTFNTQNSQMNAQIRALTKGDVTKEAQILALDAMRALTELDALAREYEELNRNYPKK